MCDFKPAEKLKRFKFCETYKDQPKMFLDGFFCDEIIFRFDEDGRVFLSTGSIPPNATNKANSVAVWVCVCRSGQNSFVQIKERYGSKHFLDLMESNVLPIVNDGCQDRTFVMDQFPVHICSAVTDWFKKQTNISLLLLPPNSFDLNPVSKVCDQIATTLNSKNIDIKSASELWKSVSDIFYTATSTTFISDCIMQIPHIIETIAENGGN